MTSATNNDSERQIFSVSELNQMVRTLLEDAFPPIWVEGEISNFKSFTSGHWYFSIKDATASVNCAMFRGKNLVVNFKPENGMHIVARGKLGLYEARGDFQLIVDLMEQAGDGALQRAFEALKKKLQQEGLFEQVHKKALPSSPRSIGVITSATGAAVRDILHVLNRRAPQIPVIIYPSLVQGDTAPSQIVKALQIANQRAECDVLIVARGGGSIEDLWAFNDEKVARAIFASEIPVVSAIGHEIDFTIADFVADLRAPTPSAAAELVSPNIQDWLQQLMNWQSYLQQKITQFIKQQHLSLENLTKRLRHPGQRLREQAQRLDELEQSLHRVINNLLKYKQQQLLNLMRTLDAVSPLNTLARGYAIAKLENSSEILRDATQAKINDKIHLQLAKGNLRCLVTEKLDEN